MNHVVLIETYWNVKYHRSQKQGFTGHVLIETYWNVKLEDYREIRAMQCGINRNILECKEKRLLHRQNLRGGINRNILECKDAST